MKSHFYNSSLSGQPIPEEDVLNYDSSSSSSSLDGQNENSFTYPQDLLGTSWGSYLHSGPPTAGRSSRKVVINPAPQPLQNKPPPVSVHSADQVSPRGILRTPVAKDVADQTSLKAQPHPLLQELQSLVSMVLGAKDKLGRNGMDNSSLSSLCDTLVTTHYELKQTLEHMSHSADASTDLLSSGFLQLVIKCLKTILQSVCEQGEKVQEQAVFLQQAGKQLSKNQRDFLKEHEELQQAIERSRAQLVIDKQELEEKKEALNTAENNFKRHLEDFGMMRPVVNRANPRPGRTQMVSLAQTQKEQSRLEKVLLQQQREIRNLQRAQELSKAELLVTQEHAQRLQHKLHKSNKEAECNQTALSYQLQTTKESLAMTTWELDRQKRKSQEAASKMRHKDQVLTSMKGISTSQKALHHEIDRMKRRISDQQGKEQHLRKQFDVSCQRLRETGSRLRQQAAWIAGQYPLPAEKMTRELHRRKQKQTNSTPVTLPKIQSPVRKPRLPSYCFSKSELVTLARFDDQETAEQVIEWLGQQGKLTDIS